MCADLNTAKTNGSTSLTLPEKEASKLISLHCSPKDGTPYMYTFSGADLGWESEEKKAVAAGRARDVGWIGEDERQLMDFEGEDLDGSVWPLENDSGDVATDGEQIDLSKFVVPGSPEPFSDEGSGSVAERGRGAGR